MDNRFCFNMWNPIRTRDQKRDALYQQLTEKIVCLKKDKACALTIQRQLQLQINSQSDPTWIELALIKGLGLTPEDQQKVFFRSKQNAVD